MNSSSVLIAGLGADPSDTRPILLIPYMWIGDFVRCHTVVRILKARWPNRPVDVLTTKLCAPLLDYMPGVRKGIISDLPRGAIAIAAQRELAARLRAENYATALVMLRTWKSALAPALAGIPQRIGFFGEMRFWLINDIRPGERARERMVDRCSVLALPRDFAEPEAWPAPQIIVPPEAIAAWRAANGIPTGPAVALAPGSVGPAKRWAHYAEAARLIAGAGFPVWVIGGPAEKDIAAELVRAGGPLVRDMTGNDLRNGILALAAAGAAVTNDSGLLHVSAAIGTPTIGIFGPTSAFHWAPLNPLAAVVETKTDVVCRPCHRPVCKEKHHRCMVDIPACDVAAAVMGALHSPHPTTAVRPAR